MTPPLDNYEPRLSPSPYVMDLLTGRVRHLGTPGAAQPMERPWSTGIYKSPVSGSVWLNYTGLENDEVGDTRNHGGPEKALFAYPAGHYEYWKILPGLEAIRVGGMGENLAVGNGDESSVCVGDIYRLGQAVIEVSQPRQPCWKPARRYRTKDLALRIQETGRTGWYFRVLKEGLVRAGVELTLQERPWPRWSIAACNDVMHHDTMDQALVRDLANCPALGENWKRTLEKRLAGQESSIAPRVWGPNRD